MNHGMELQTVCFTACSMFSRILSHIKCWLPNFTKYIDSWDTVYMKKATEFKLNIFSFIFFVNLLVDLLSEDTVNWKSVFFHHHFSTKGKEEWTKGDY